MTSVTLKPRNLLVFLSSGALLLGVPTVAYGQGESGAAPAVPGGAEAKMREFETEAIGADHAAAHARQREIAREAPADDRSASLTPRAAPAPVVPVAKGGKWEDATPIPVIAINAIMLPTGKVLMFAYPARPGYGDYAKAFVWDPVSGTSDPVDPPIDPDTSQPTNIWCGGASFLPDGRVLVAGGNVNDPLNDFHGIRKVFTFDPVAENGICRRPTRTWPRGAGTPRRCSCPMAAR